MHTKTPMHRNTHLYNMISSVLIALFILNIHSTFYVMNAFMVLLWHTKYNSVNYLLKIN